MNVIRFFLGSGPRVVATLIALPLYLGAIVWGVIAYEGRIRYALSLLQEFSMHLLVLVLVGFGMSLMVRSAFRR